MKTNRYLARGLSLGLALLLTVLPAVAQQASTAPEPPAASPSASLPDSPSASQPMTPQQSQSSQPAKAKPSGTAASEMTNVGGMTASEPAGVAIAPAKQHRARSILIKMGAILGAGAAVGTVAALS